MRSVRGSVGYWALVLAASVFLAGFASLAVAQDDDAAFGIHEHFRLDDPADLDDAAAEAIYRELVDDLAERYGRSEDATARDYRDWRRFNRAPYRSATHGERFVNNYGNGIAEGPYARAERGVAMPAGSVLAKDSFSVTADGTVLPSAFFIMEKMAPGFAPKNGDWRYAMILPDGSVLGDTNGDNGAEMRFCADCHVARKAYDYLFFMPKRVRQVD
ncbi:cytochrome P460 family protein [Oceanibacterium hippocampi]|uniref:Cytochrome P460 domain-containing protein n=1 Tax=Oceanibacterium hippocampi TaxID=745714 RepID=A0A1Y5SRN4_9PROT|nr:cytochrome P460 family protein [Oceanibacterium hippocampi]SLN45423.1 hypothetical protein OCH7691_01952 [Oceanibacterium hippocampi]